jgi:hypothetical protein
MSDKYKKTAKELLRKNLIPTIRGKNTDIILESLAQSAGILLKNVEAVNDQIFIATATGKFLDNLLAGKNIIRPASLGIEDDVFREIGIEITNRKQVRDLINNILEIIYGPEYTRAQVFSNQVEPYSLQNNDKIIVQFDDGKPVELIFSSSDFSNITIATAQEVADAITRNLRNQGISGFATTRNDGYGAFVVLSSPSTGPSSAIRVLGGRAQNILQFPSPRATSADFSTQWDIEIKQGGIVRMTWTAGVNPSIGKVKAGDYVNIFGGGFFAENQGTFTIKKSQGGSVNNAYIEFENLEASPQVATQGTNNAVLFFNPQRITITDYPAYASSFHTQTRTLQIFLPALTRVVRRERIGAAHLNDAPPIVLSDVTGDAGPYLWDITKPFTITKYSSELIKKVDFSTQNILEVADSTSFPDEAGFFVLGFGTALEEGPIPYVGRPSPSTILLNPSYKIKNVHQSGTDITLIGSNTPYTPESDGSDYGAYITDVVGGRIWAQELIDFVAAAGINLVFTVLYPDPIGLEKWESEIQESKDKWQKVFGE